MNAAWSRLVAELALWSGGGRLLEVWLRDDDAIAPSAALDSLLALCRRFDLPVLLAVIPGLATPELAARLAFEPLAHPCQHGWTHLSHAPPHEKNAEFGDHRGLEAMLAEIGEGRARLGALFGDHVAPVFVPPWNRISPALAARLPGAGFSALSAFRPFRPDVPGLAIVHPDIDIIDWKAGKRLRLAAELEAEIVARLAAIRMNPPAETARLGLLLHHLVQGADAWHLLTDMLTVLSACPMVRFAEPAAFRPA